MIAFLKYWVCFLITMLMMTVVLDSAEAEERTPLPMPRRMLELKKHGTVNVTRDEAGNVEKIRLVVTSYLIKLDEGSKPLEDMDGQKARVFATYEKIDDEGWLTVSKVEPLVEETAEPEDEEAIDPEDEEAESEE